MKNYDRRVCMVCLKDLEGLQVVSGIPVAVNKDGTFRQLYGHYLCVCGELGPAKVLKAITLKLLPLITEDALIDGKLKAMVAARDKGATPLSKIYEFIKN